MNVNNEMIELGQSFVQVYKIDVLWKKVLRSVYKELHADHETGAADNK